MREPHDLTDASYWSWKDLRGNAFAEALSKAYGRPRATSPKPPEPVNPHPIASDLNFREILEQHGIKLD